MITRIIEIVLFNFLFYAPMLNYKLVNDDLAMMKTAPYNVKRAKITSIILHTLVAVYIYYAFGASNLSFFAAMLFSAHPLTIQISAWWSSRYYAVSAILILMIIAFAPLAGVLYFLTITSTLTATLFTPLMFIFTPHWYLALLCPVIFFLGRRTLKRDINLRAKRQEIFVTPNEFKIGKFRWANLIIVVKTFGYYSLACLLPVKNGFYNSFLVTIGSSQKETDYWYSINKHFFGGLIAMFLVASFWWPNRANIIGFGLALFVLSIGPFLNFITVQMWTSPRYAYIALIGFQIALVNILARYGVPGYCVMTALWLFYLDRTVRVRKIYAKDNITMMELDSQVFPDNPRLWYYRYEHMLYKRNPIMAWAEASYGLKHLPYDCQLWFGLACASFELGDLKAALTFLETSEKFMIITERKNMQHLIADLRKKIQDAQRG